MSFLRALVVSIVRQYGMVVKYLGSYLMHIGLDFGTTTTVASVFDGHQVHMIPLDQTESTPTLLRSALLISREGEVMVGRTAIDYYMASNVGRQIIYKEVMFGVFQMHFADMTVTR